VQTLVPPRKQQKKQEKIILIDLEDMSALNI
jgi:hypothetical protein